MTEDDDKLLRAVNGSGFLLQLAIEHEVTKSQAQHHWTVASHEHRWVDPVTAAEGYIDLILEMQGEVVRMVLECKRITDARWVFLAPNLSARKLQRSRIPWTDQVDDKEKTLDWADFNLLPESEEAEFCVPVRQGDKDPMLLEKLSGTLLRSTEALADELNFSVSKHRSPHVYVPVVLTTAQLYLGRFSLGSVDAATGTLPEGDFYPIPFIRFRKSLSTTRPAGGEHYHLRDARQLQDRSVFVVQASAFIDFLKAFQIRAPFWDEWPWEAARRVRRDRESQEEAYKRINQGATARLGQ